MYALKICMNNSEHLCEKCVNHEMLKCVNISAQNLRTILSFHENAEISLLKSRNVNSAESELEKCVKLKEDGYE